MDERISRVLEKMKEKGIDQLLVSDPLSIRFLTGIMVNPGERLYALLLRTSGTYIIPELSVLCIKYRIRRSMVQ